MTFAYHYRALRFQSTLWRSHFEGVRRFLSAWTPAKKNLILIGPSGGYSLPLSWLARFESITAVEPSFMARQILAQKLNILPDAPTIELLSKPLDFEDPKFLSSFDQKDSAILFCNVLGQVKVGSEARFALSLQEALSGIPWASYHDRFSASRVHWRAPPDWQTRVLRTDELIVESQERAEVQEHLASDALAALHPLRVTYWDWQIAPKQVHLIEGVISNS